MASGSNRLKGPAKIFANSAPGFRFSVWGGQAPKTITAGTGDSYPTQMARGVLLTAKSLEWLLASLHWARQGVLLFIEREVPFLQDGANVTVY
jgi:hypothetical protein